MEKIDLHCRIPAEVDEVGTAECQDGVICSEWLRCVNKYS